jgi:hypothetical protein
MKTRERPAWAEAVPDQEPDHRVVRCSSCRQVMGWRELVYRHGPACEGGETDGERES